MRLANKVAVITGAGSGMGQAIAVEFAREGAKVALGDINDAAGAKTLSMVRSSGGEAIFAHADVSSEAGAANLVKAARDSFGKIDILFNGAGIAGGRTPIEKIDESAWDHVFAVNLKSVVFMVKYVAPVMKAARNGSIINVGSIGGVNPRPGASYAYGSSKAAVILLTKALAQDFAPFNIRVNCLNPGRTDTPFNLQNTPPGVSLEEFNASALPHIPLHRLVKPEEIAYAAVFLASDESATMTGTSITIDGGRTI